MIKSPIRMVDLKTQYNRAKSEIDNAIQKVIDDTSFIKGEEVGLFEKELADYLGVKHVVTCGNGTDALQIALMALALKPGDEIITANFTFIASAEVIALLGLTPVIVDVDPNTFVITPEAIEKAITQKTRAIIPVHLFGQCADMEGIMQIAEKHNLFVIEDVAQANGAWVEFSNSKKYKAGTIGHFGCTSFFPSKNLGCYGDGGAIFSNDSSLSEKCQMITNHGMKIRYHHDIIGVNSRLDTIQAAILRVKLKYLDDYNYRRQWAASYYDRHLSNIERIQIPERTPFSSHIFHQYTLIVKNGLRDALKTYLGNAEIPSMVYYPVPLHKQKAFAPYLKPNQSFLVSEVLSETVLSLPMHSELDEEQLNYICTTISDFFNQHA